MRGFRAKLAESIAITRSLQVRTNSSMVIRMSLVSYEAETTTHRGLINL